MNVIESSLNLFCREVCFYDECEVGSEKNRAHFRTL